MSVVELCCQNRVALVAEYDSDIHAFTRLVEVINPHLVPFGCRDGSGSVTKRSLTSWWHERSIPVTRDGYHSIVDDLDGVSPLELLDTSLGLSLSDQFWIRKADSPVRWEDVNFFDNGYGDELGLLTLGSAARAGSPAAGDSRDPNSSLGGDLRKAWERRGEGNWLVKRGRGPYDQEAANEFVASSLHARLLEAEDFVPYSLEVRDGRLCSVCPDMVDRDECLVPAWDIINASKRPGHQSPWQHLLECYSALGVEGAGDQLAKMFVCDFVIANHDRHWNNLGVIMDAETMTEARVAPIFDSGSSLWCDASTLEDPIDYWYRPLPLIRERARRIEPTEQLSLMKGHLRWLDAPALDGFAEEAAAILTDHTSMPNDRVEAVRRGIVRNVETVRSFERSQRPLAPAVGDLRSQIDSARSGRSASAETRGDGQAR